MKKLEKRVAEINSLLCVGIDQTVSDYAFSSLMGPAAAMKFNLGYYLSRDIIPILVERVRWASRMGVFTILDGKFGDVAHTAEMYATFAYDRIGADAVTVNPYMGDQAIYPFLREGKGVFLLAHTSAELGDMDIQEACSFRTCYKIREKENPAIGAVIGSSLDRPADFAAYREHLGNSWMLVPGIGAQGGALANAVSYGQRKDLSGVLINVGRGLLSAERPYEAAVRYKDEINAYRYK